MSGLISPLMLLAGTSSDRLTHRPHDAANLITSQSGRTQSNHSGLAKELTPETLMPFISAVFCAPGADQGESLSVIGLLGDRDAVRAGGQIRRSP